MSTFEGSGLHVSPRLSTYYHGSIVSLTMFSFTIVDDVYVVSPVGEADVSPWATISGNIVAKESS